MLINFIYLLKNEHQLHMCTPLHKQQNTTWVISSLESRSFVVNMSTVTIPFLYKS
jgi:hypothetical protein